MSRYLKLFKRTFTSAKSAPIVTKPADLQQSIVNHIYRLSYQDVKQLYPQGFPKSLLKQGEVIGNVGWILRDQSWRIIKELQDEGHDSREGYVLYGPSGSGKTVSLLQIIHQCVLNGLIVVHIPSVFNWVHPKSESKPGRDTGVYDVPNESCSWLQYFRAMNAKLLGEIKLSESYSWTKKERSDKGDGLLKAIEQGIIRPNIATDVALCVLKEMSQTSYKVVLAIDDFNGCFVSKSFKLPNSEWVSAESITFVKHLLEYANPSKINGPVLTGLSRRMLRHDCPSSDAPDDLLGPEGMSFVKGFKMIEVPNFSKKEAKECLEFYNQNQLFSRTPDTKIFNELWHVSGAGNPGELYKLCRSV